MKKKIFISLGVFIMGLTFCCTKFALAYNYGDYRSVTLTGKAWKALRAGDLDAVLAYTNKCIELYGEQARKMQDTLVDFPKKSKEEIFGYWALNDVATSLFIQAEAYRQKNRMEQAKEIYQKIIDHYGYAQSWDDRGWFWRVAEAAQANLGMLEAGIMLDFGDYSSEHLVKKAWESLANNDTEAVVAYVDICLKLYGDKAQEMQNSLTEYPWESNEKIFSYWALNDVGTALFVKGEAYQKAGQAEKAQKAYQALVDHYYYAQCWDPNGWFWKPAEAAEKNLNALTSV